MRDLKAKQEKKIDRERRIKIAPVWNFTKNLPENLAKLESEEFANILKNATKLKEKHDKEQAEIKAKADAKEAELKKEREEKQRLERELAEKARKEREEAERRQREEKAESERLEAERIAKEQAPDKEKLKAYFTELLEIKQPSFNNQKFADLGILFRNKLESLISNFESKF